MTTPHEHVKTSMQAYRRAHETIRQRAAELRAEREAEWAAGARDSAKIDQEYEAGLIHAGSATQPQAQG